MSKRRQKNGTLKLRRETVAALDEETLANVRGGDGELIPHGIGQTATDGTGTSRLGQRLCTPSGTGEIIG